jgi:hypothetical protein
MYMVVAVLIVSLLWLCPVMGEAGTPGPDTPAVPGAPGTPGGQRPPQR